MFFCNYDIADIAGGKLWCSGQ